MRILVVADDDSFIRTTPVGSSDLVISCGDLASTALLEAIRLTSAPRGFAVKGNHDDTGPFPPPIEDIHLRVSCYSGVRFGGFAGAWRYKPRGHFLFDQDEVNRLLASFPTVDVFVAHNSPRHIHDRDDEVHLGFSAFRDYIERVKPRIFFHGHQHVNTESFIDKTRIVGVYGAKYFDI